MNDLSHLQSRMKLSLHHALRIIFPSEFQPDSVIKPHHWGNPDYVGELDGKTIWWNGWSANLSEISPQYRTIYIDYVENVLPEGLRVKIFGERFAEEIRDIPSFVVMHVGGFASSLKEKVEADGFIVRSMGKNIHPCFVVSTETFLNNTELHWAAQIARLINYQVQVLGTRS